MAHEPATDVRWDVSGSTKKLAELACEHIGAKSTDDFVASAISLYMLLAESAQRQEPVRFEWVQSDSVGNFIVPQFPSHGDDGDQKRQCA
jgi:hypothetical protein